MQLVSVIMGTYNPSESIFSSVNSILTQSYSNFEFIIYNDGSDDADSINRILKLQSMDTRIIVIDSKENKGLAYALNQCIMKSKSDILIRMDDDDISHHERIKKLVKKSLDFPCAAVIGTWSSIFESNGKKWGFNHPPAYPTKLDAFRGYAFIHASVLLRKNEIKEINFYNTSKNIIRLEDYDLWIRIYMNGKFGINITEELYSYFEDHSSIEKRNVSFRFREFKLRLSYLIKLKLYPVGILHTIKPLILIITPKFLYQKTRKFRLKDLHK